MSNWTLFPSCLGCAMLAIACSDDASGAGPADGGAAGVGAAGSGGLSGDSGVGGSNGSGASGGSGGSGGQPALDPPSCDGAVGTCGQSESCCKAAPVPGGSFQRSPGASSTLSAFSLDSFEVTVGRFRRFVELAAATESSPPDPGSGAHPKIAMSGWNALWDGYLASDAAALELALHCSPSYATWTEAPGANEERPVNCVTWYEAVAFCAWDGGRLPTDSEWAYAAAGGSEQRTYPWSSPPDSLALGPENASYREGVDCLGDGDPECALTDLLSAGSKSAGLSRWNQADLAGNVSEWVLDNGALFPSECDDCASLEDRPDRIHRGGSYQDQESWLRAVNYRTEGPDIRSDEIGFRCARDL